MKDYLAFSQRNKLAKIIEQEMEDKGIPKASTADVFNVITALEIRGYLDRPLIKKSLQKIHATKTQALSQGDQGQSYRQP